MAACDVALKWGEYQPPLHQESLNLVTEVSKLGFNSVYEYTVDEFRQKLDKMYTQLRKQIDYDGTIEDRVVPSNDRKGGVPVRIYTPKVIHEDPVLLVYFHGGGMVVSGYHNLISQHKVMSRTFKCIIIDVEYRNCPEHKALSAFDDCKVVTEWVMQNRTSLGGTDMSPVGLAGDSAGGLCTIQVTHRVQGLDFQIPIYPWLDMSNSLPSKIDMAEGPFCPLEWLKWFAERVVDYDIGDEKDTRWSPVYYTKDDVKNVPPALFVLAEIDPCRDDGRVYAKTLIDAGIPTEVFQVKGAVHGFITLPEHFKELSSQAYTKMNRFLDWIREAKSAGKKGK